MTAGRIIIGLADQIFMGPLNQPVLYMVGRQRQKKLGTVPRVIGFDKCQILGCDIELMLFLECFIGSTEICEERELY